MKKRFTDEQIIAMLKEQEAGEVIPPKKVVFMRRIFSAY